MNDATLRTPVTDPEVLLEGPVFSDEIGWRSGLQTKTLDDVEYESLRIVPAKEAMSGVYSIYFRPQHRRWALVRYAQRYRWLVEIVLGRGLSGQQVLLRQGFREEDIAFLDEIVPVPEYSPAVYEILWRAITEYAYVPLSRKLDEVETFVPSEIVREHPDLSMDDVGLLDQFLRRHLIQSEEAADQSRNGPNQTVDTVSCDPETRYEKTSEGERAISAIVEEYERLVVAESYDPLRIPEPETADEHIEAAPKADRGSVTRPVTEEEETDVESLNDDIDDILTDLTADGDP